MNKKINTILFVLGATLFNIIIALISFMIFLVIYAKYFMNKLPESSKDWSYSLLLIASLAVSFLVYRIVLKALINKIDIEKYFDPIFARKYRKQNKYIDHS
jgi:hypothetical protein